MIALPGLTFSTNRPEIARTILLEFSRHISQGMIPNRFPDEGDVPDYNTVDATLWYFEALRVYVEKTGDYELVRELYPKLLNIVEFHVLGTRHRIGVDDDGLLAAGEDGTQLTWMDAKVGDWVITPRIGKPVEIQALWYNALCVLADIADHLDDSPESAKLLAMAAKAKRSFNEKFWNETEKCLYDVVRDDGLDASVRPNQIIALSLRYSMVDQERATAIVEKVESELLTPYGLRSLSPLDSRYRPLYTGSPIERDSSYHQGTVWAWLIGPYIDAFRRVHANEAGLDARVREILTGFRSHLNEAGVGQISEIFDGDPPHVPRGCPAQAWSVGELLRVL
jgi:predicted glycogen debranching enzyme